MGQGWRLSGGDQPVCGEVCRVWAVQPWPDQSLGRRLALGPRRGIL